MTRATQDDERVALEASEVADRGPAALATERPLGTLRAPDFFGEMGVMTGEPRSADVVAITDVECYRLDKPGLKKILEARPEIAQAFSKSTALRRVELSAAQEHLDEQAQQDRLASEETRILDRMQEFFGLERTTRI